MITETIPGGINMANNWCEQTPNLVLHEFEIYDNCSPTIIMNQFHGHSFYELRFIKNGLIHHYCENSSIELGPGDFSLLPPGFFHRVTPISSEKKISNYTRLLLYVSTDLVRSLDSDRFCLSEVFDSFGTSGTQHIHMDADELDSYYLPLQEIVRRNRDDDPLTHLINRAQVELVLARMAERILQLSEPVAPAVDTSLVPRVIAHINANLSENLSLDSLAERFFVSKFYLSHQFKQYTQLSLHQYVLTRRMMHAQLLLRSGEAPTSVAAACGYHEYSSFYKAFLRETGQSPRMFE